MSSPLLNDFAIPPTSIEYILLFGFYDLLCQCSISDIVTQAEPLNVLIRFGLLFCVISFTNHAFVSHWAWNDEDQGAALDWTCSQSQSRGGPSI